MINKKILVPVMVTALAISSISVNYNNGTNICNIVKAEEKLLTETVDGMVIENGILKRYEGNAADIVIPEGVITIGEYAFEYKDCIKSVSIPESVTEIGQYAFYGCKNLEEVENKGNIDTIMDVAFSGCEKLSIMDLSNVKHIGRVAFYGCDLKEIKLDAVESIESGAFRASGIETVELNFVGEDGFIGDVAFVECDNLAEVTIKGKISKIEDETFLKCKALENIQIEDSSNITYIGGRAFDQTPWLTEQLNKSEDNMLIINHILVKYQPNVFYAGEYEGIPYEELSAREEDSKMKDSNFTYTAPANAKMETVTIPSDVKAIAGDAFYGAYSVENIIFDSEIKSIEIGEGAFDFTTWEKDYLEQENFLIIAGTLVKAKYNAEVIEVPNGVKKVLSGAFMVDCFTGKVPTEEIVKVKELVFPQSVEEIGSWNFSPAMNDTSWNIETIIAPTVFEEKAPPNVECKDVDTTTWAKDLLVGYEQEENPSPTTAITGSPQPTIAETISPTVEATQSPSPTLDATQSPSPTVEVTKSPNPTVEVTQSPSPTAEVTQSPSPTVEVTQSPSPTMEATKSPNPTVPSTQSPSPTVEATQSPSPIVPGTQTPSPTIPGTPSPIPTADVTDTPQTTKAPALAIKVKKAAIKKVKRVSNKKIKVCIKKKENVKGYQILASTDKKFKKNLKKVSTTSRNVLLKNLKKGDRKSVV